MLPATWVSRNVPIPVCPRVNREIRFERSRADCWNGHVKKPRKLKTLQSSFLEACVHP